MEMQLNDTGAKFGIVVRLADPIRMNDAGMWEKTYHSKPGYRIWMDGEFEVLSEQQVIKLKRLWNLI